MIEYLEKPIAQIQLFGTIEQIELAQALAKEIEKNKAALLDDLLNDLRNDLRKELNLKKAPEKMIVLRINSD